MAVELWLDTNIIIRFLANDHPEHSKIAREIFKNTQEGKIVLHINPMVIAECCFVLEGKHYSYDHGTIASKLKALLNVKGIKTKEKKVLLRALDLYAKNAVDFEDTYIAAYAQINEPNEIVSFNLKDFRKIGAECYSPADVLMG